MIQKGDYIYFGGNINLNYTHHIKGTHNRYERRTIKLK